MMIKEYEREFIFVVGGFKGRCCKKQGQARGGFGGSPPK